MRQRDSELNSYWGTICTPLRLKALDGKMRKINCANTEGIFRIIQSIPSPKAEPFKRWLAKVGYERVQEIDDPELELKDPVPCIRQKIILTTGLKSECAVSPSGRNLQTSGKQGR